MQTRIIVGGAVIFAAMLAMSIATYFSSQEAYYTVDELVANAAVYPAAGAVQAAELETEPAALGEPVGRRMQIRGGVDKASVRRPADGLELRFVMTGKRGRVPVVYRGVVPDTFDLAESVTVGGRVTAEGGFEADQLLVQCPSKYEAVPPGQAKPSGSAADG